MKVTYKKILTLQSFQEAISKLNLSPEDYAAISKINKVVKKLADSISDFQESVEDLRLDNCYKEGSKIVRENGQLQWSAEGEKAFRKAYKDLLNEEVEINVEPINYSELFAILPKEVQASNKWDDVEEALSPFFINK